MPPPKVEVNTYFGQCKCCLNYAYLKNMWEQHTTEEEQNVIYGKRLVECFSISWKIRDKAEDDKICETCISRLEEAFNFKKQVLTARNERLHKIKFEETPIEIEISTPIVVEPTDTEQRAFEDIEFLEDEAMDDGSSQIDDENRDSKGHRKPKNERTQKTIKNERRKQYSDETVRKAVEAIQSKELSVREASQKYNIPLRTMHVKAKNIAEKKESPVDDGEDSTEKSPEDEIDYQKELILKQHKENVQSILVASNATPIRGHCGLGYTCHFCPQQFPTPGELKQHTFEHEDFTFNVRSVREHIVKLDVTGLKCNLCDVNIQTLEELMVHLKEIHHMPMNLDIPNHLVAFNFENKVMKCVKCPKEFSSFKPLSEHMNDVHCRNYECLLCERGFVNLRSLKSHSIRHKIGVFACSHCSKVFNTRIKVIEHERVVHHLNTMTRKCSVCDERFMDVVKRTKHEVEVHGLPKPEFRCGACTKAFESRRALLTHINGVHLLYKPHKCMECASSFYLKHQLKRHIAKIHTGDFRPHQCLLCFKRYSTSKALRDHNLKHGDSRKHSCKICGRWFQKVENYVTHVKNKHGCNDEI